MAGLGAEPLAIFVGGVLRHRNCRKPILTHPETHLDVGFGRMRYPISELVRGFVARETAAHPLLFIRIHEQLIFIPGDFELLHPEWRNFYLMLRAFIRLVAGLRIRTAHDELAPGDRYHRIFYRRARNGVGVSLHV